MDKKTSKLLEVYQDYGIDIALERAKYSTSRYSYNRPVGENIIKADVILSAWLNYCRESRLYRLLEFFGLR